MNYIPEAYKTEFENGIQHPDLYLWDAWSYAENGLIHLYCLAIPRYTLDVMKIDPRERNNFQFHIRHFTSKNDRKEYDRALKQHGIKIHESNYPRGPSNFYPKLFTIFFKSIKSVLFKLFIPSYSFLYTFYALLRTIKT